MPRQSPHRPVAQRHDFCRGGGLAAPPRGSGGGVVVLSPRSGDPTGARSRRRRRRRLKSCQTVDAGVFQQRTEDHHEARHQEDVDALEVRDLGCGEFLTESQACLD